MVEHKVSDWLDALVQQLDKHGSVLVKAPVAVTEVKVFLRIVARTVCPGITRRRQPEQGKVAVPDSAGVLPDNDIPRLVAELAEPLVFGMPMPIRFPIEALQHHAVIIEPRLRKDPNTTEDNNSNCDQQP